MVSLDFLFWMYVVLFGMIGFMRGWVKELLVAFSVILALAFTTLLQTYVPFIKDGLPPNSADFFWFRSMLLLALVIFGYQSPNITRFAASARREKLQDSLFGFFLGALNGYLIAGTMWFYLAQAQYPFDFIVKPAPDSLLMPYLAPVLLNVPEVYFAALIAFIFVLVVFI